MKKITAFNKTLSKLKKDIIEQIKVELLVARKKDSGRYLMEGSGLFISSEYGNEEVDVVLIDWTDSEAIITLRTENSSFELDEMNVNDLLCFYGLIQCKEFIIKSC